VAVVNRRYRLGEANVAVVNRPWMIPLVLRGSRQGA